MAKSILGALLFDRKPAVPDLPEISAQEAQRTALTGNLQAMPQLKRLGSNVNRFLAEEITKAAERIMPGYSKLLQSGTEAIQSGVEGNLPEGVARNLRRYAAEYGVGAGTVGSEFSDFAAVNLLGRESLNYSLNALNTADRWLSQARSATPMFNFQSMFVSPAQQIAVNQYNQQTQWQHQWMKNQLEAAPEGWEAAVQGLMDWIATTSLNVAGSYAGQMGSGGQPGQNVGGGGGGFSEGGGITGSSPSTFSSIPSSGSYGSYGGYTPMNFGPANYYPGSVSPYGASSYSGAATYNPALTDFY